MSKGTIAFAKTQVILIAAEQSRQSKQRKDQAIVKRPRQYYGDGHTEGLEPVDPSISLGRLAGSRSSLLFMSATILPSWM